MSEVREMIYASDARCPCGAGLAYWKNPTRDEQWWDCSAIMRGEAIPSGQPGSVEHTGQKPFVFWKVKSQSQPSAMGATTRPVPRAVPASPARGDP
jgi:hypothetical protein